MARQAKLQKKNGYWFTSAGPCRRYFGRVGVVSYEDALKTFREHLASTAKAPDVLPPIVSGTIGELADRFLTWVKRHRAASNWRERKRHLDRFCQTYGNEPVQSIATADIEDWISQLPGAKDYVRKHVTSLKAMFRWGSKRGMAQMAIFATLEPIRLAKGVLNADTLPTREEVAALLCHAGREQDMLRVYYATGARTHELTEARVGDYHPRTRQIILTQHKRAFTLKEPRPRIIILNTEAVAIVERACHNRAPDDYIFQAPMGGHWTSNALGARFREIREAASVRPLTIYSFRHLWISEMLMAGINMQLIATMAGTSVAMIERVYGHWRPEKFQDAQATLDAIRSR